MGFRFILTTALSRYGKVKNGNGNFQLLQRCTQSYRPVSFNIFSSILHVAQPLGPVGHEELLDQILRHGVNVTGPVYLAAEDLLVDPEGIVVKERRVAGQHLVDEDAEGPPVHRLVVALRLDDLGRQVLRGPAQGPGPVSYPLGKPEICDLQMSSPDNKQQIISQSTGLQGLNGCLTKCYRWNSNRLPKLRIRTVIPLTNCFLLAQTV